MSVCSPLINPLIASAKRFLLQNSLQPGTFVRMFLGQLVARSFVFIYISGSIVIFNIFWVQSALADLHQGVGEAPQLASPTGIRPSAQPTGIPAPGAAASPPGAIPSGPGNPPVLRPAPAAPRPAALSKTRAANWPPPTGLCPSPSPAPP